MVPAFQTPPVSLGKIRQPSVRKILWSANGNRASKFKKQGSVIFRVAVYFNPNSWPVLLVSAGIASKILQVFAGKIFFDLDLSYIHKVIFLVANVKTRKTIFHFKRNQPA